MNGRGFCEMVRTGQLIKQTSVGGTAETPVWRLLELSVRPTQVTIYANNCSFFLL